MHAGNPLSPPEDKTVSHEFNPDGRNLNRAAFEIAGDLDSGGSAQGIARFLQNVYRNDRRDFNELVMQVNRQERNGVGNDLTITQNGEVYVTDCNRRISVGRIDVRRNDDCDPRDRGRGGGWDRGRDHGRGRGNDVDIDIDIRIGGGRGGRYPDGHIPIPDCYPDVRPPMPHRPPVRYEPPIRHEPPVTYEPPCNTRRPPYVDRDCSPPVIRRGGPDYDPPYRRSSGEYNQDGEIAGTVIGGVIGGVIGHNNRDRSGRDNTLLGVLAGGAIGNVIGREVDRDRNRNQQNYRWR